MSNAPRILVLFGNVPLYGQERGNIEALDALRRTGCEVLFLIREEWTEDTIQAELNQRGLPFVFVPYFDSVRYGVSLRVWWNSLRGIFGGSWQLLRQIRLFRATHIHVGSTANVLNFLPALMLTRLPLVFRAGDVPPRHHVLWRMVWWFIRRRAARFVCISRFIQNTLVSMGTAPERTSVIYNAPPSRFAAGDKALRGAQAGGLTFAYMGQLTADKGLAELVDAAIAHCGQYPDSRFLIAGDFSWNNPFATNLVAHVSAAGLSDSISFLGYVSDIDRLLAATDVHLCPSVWDEPLSNVVLEAKQAGVPSVIFPSGGLPELVTHGVDGYVCSEKTAEALATAFAAYETDPTLAARQGEAARRSLDRFGLDRYAASWRRLYDDVGIPRCPRILALFGNVPLYGQERGNIEALDALRRTGCEVLFLIREEWTEDTIQAELNQRGLPFVFVPYFDSVRYGVSLRVWWNNLRGIFGGSWQLLRQIRLFRATHIHVGSTANVLNFLPALMLTRLPLVFRAGDVPPRHHVLWRMVWWFSRTRVTHFVCDSRFIQSRLEERGVKRTRTSIIYSPPPMRRRMPHDMLPSIANMYYEKCFIVLYVGQLSAGKGVGILLDVALSICSERTDVKFLLAGDFIPGDKFKENCLKKLDETSKKAEIIFTGYVSDIDKLYCVSNLHVCPSVHDEAYGLTVAEAKEHRLPSVVFESGGLPELVTSGVDGIVCGEKTAIALKQAILMYVESPEMALSHGEAAFNSLEKLGVIDFGKKWRSVYDLTNTE